MDRRLSLHSILEQTLGSTHVYYQAPATVAMRYPCLVYTLSRIDTRFADNGPYKHKKGYTITHITQDPDSDVVDRLMALPMCTFDRAYRAENLNHFVFNIYY